MFFWNTRFSDDPLDVGYLISGSSAFSKTSLNIWKFMAHSIKEWKLTQRKPLEYKTEHQSTTSCSQCRTPRPNNKQEKNTNPIFSTQNYHLTQLCTSELKKKKILSINLTKCKTYTNPWTNLQFSSVFQSCPTLWDTMNCSMLGLPVPYQEFIQTHVHWVRDAM